MPDYSIRLAHPFYTATIQPPVIARSVERIFDATGDAAFVREIFPPIARFFDWLARVRAALALVLAQDDRGIAEDVGRGHGSPLDDRDPGRPDSRGQHGSDLRDVAKAAPARQGDQRAIGA